MRIGVTGLLAVVTLVAAACGGSAADPPSTSSLASVPVSSATAAPAVSPTSPATSGPNVRPGERPPAMPAAAKQHTQEGALAFAGYFIRALDWSIATTDPKLLIPISDPACLACGSYVGEIRDLRVHGGYVRGGRISLSAAEINQSVSRTGVEYVITINTVQQPDSIIGKSQSPLSRETSTERLKSNLLLVWRRGSWIASGLEAE
jgi:Family of unknown function (DUF6318)